ncbi:MAG: bifunctional nuclease family protein [Bacteroidales bacterium]|nr:bifunctional nuclease family protein [Bacteroidales bacterium]
MDAKVKLRVLGLTFSQSQSGAYALLLGEDKGKRRLPVIVGILEAQSIATVLEGLESPRPLTHDLFASFIQSVHCRLDSVLIYRFEGGIFYSKVVFLNGNDPIILDARTSDAVALALRLKAPIYVTASILDVAGVVFDDEPDILDIEETEEETLEELKNRLQRAVDDENYELASRLRDEIKRKE